MTEQIKRAVVVLLLLALLLGLAGCGGITARDEPLTHLASTAETAMADQSTSTEPTTKIKYEEFDLSNGWPDWCHDMGAPEFREEISQTLGQRFATMDEAKAVANRILVSEQKKGRLTEHALFHIVHDPNKNIWIFIYAMAEWVPGGDYYVAIDGNSGELLRVGAGE